MQMQETIKLLVKVIKEYFALHGHYKNDIIICSQNFEDSDKRIRNSRILQVDKLELFSCSPYSWARCYYTACPLPLRLRFLLRGYTVNLNLFYQMFDSFSAPALALNPSELWDFGAPALSRADHSFIRSHCLQMIPAGAPPPI